MIGRNIWVPSHKLPSFHSTGFYDWRLVDDASNHEVMKGRFVVFPKNTRNHSYYEIPSDLEIAHRTDSKAATSSTLSLVHNLIPALKEKGVDVLSFAIPPAHSTHPLLSTDTEEIGLRMSSVDSSPLETSSENEGISLADSKSSLLFPSDHYFFGTDAEFQSLHKEFFFPVLHITR